MKLYFVYILECSDESFYVGLTNNIDRRLSEHQGGLSSSSYTFKRRPVKLVYTKTSGSSWMRSSLKSSSKDGAGTKNRL
ncbi:GIY-YIG nuclease family protein [Pedobacter yulinensis]|uniref:GIY-YIG nuclease family protein n=1 Tax=Pedobacter yulinensis TaxID=2126353 RepID=UPI001EF8884E|nr:GIY-YIG nuclease family protein [Pedobacter yulinensis]